MVSIIIPMRNEQNFVAACLDSVAEQLKELPEAEILCVDGASTDRTRSIVLEYAAREPKVRLIDNPAKIVPVAMNLAILEAKGEVIIRLDCHAEYEKDYIKNCLATLERTGADNVGGYIITRAKADSPASRAIVAATSSRFGVGSSVFRTGGGEQEVDTVPFGCFRRDVFTRFGFYDERLVRNQDIELNSRIRAGGGKIIISPSIRAIYYNRSTFAGLRQQSFNNGLWNSYTVYLTGGGLALRHFIPSLFVGTVTLLALAGFWQSIFWWLLCLELLLYLAVGTPAAIKAGRENDASPLLVMACFLQLHCAYGIGTLWGWIRAPFKYGWSSAKQGRAKALPDRLE